MVRMKRDRAMLARLLIGIVTAWNLQAAAVFVLRPADFAAGFELSGAAGEAAVRGTAVLFVMWNVPYLAALWDPRRFRLALTLAIVMQFAGLVGETWILSSLAPEHTVLRGSILRFIQFDGAGLILLLLAFFLSKQASPGGA